MTAGDPGPDRACSIRCVVTGVAQVAFPRAANGSLVADGTGAVVGSELIGQALREPGYFQPRPSAAGAAATTPRRRRARTSARPPRSCATGSTADVARLRAREPAGAGAVPVELVTTSAQRPRPAPQPGGRAVAGAARGRGARRAARGRSRRSSTRAIEARTFGLLGEPRVNVLLLNLELDRRFRAARPARADPWPEDGDRLFYLGRADRGDRDRRRADAPARRHRRLQLHVRVHGPHHPRWRSSAADRRAGDRPRSALSLDFFLTSPTCASRSTTRTT